MKLKTRIIAFILMLLTVFYAIPVSVFAEVAFSEKSGKKANQVRQKYKLLRKIPTVSWLQ